MICSCAAFTLNVRACGGGDLRSGSLPVQVALSIALTSTHSLGTGQAHFQLIY